MREPPCNPTVGTSSLGEAFSKCGLRDQSDLSFISRLEPTRRPAARSTIRRTICRRGGPRWIRGDALQTITSRALVGDLARGCPIVFCTDAVMSMLHAHCIHAEEGLHRPRFTDEFLPVLMVSVEDYPRASALADSVAPMLNVMAY
jgi:hypothetical protein